MAPPVLVCLHGLGRGPADWDGVRAGLERFGRVLTPGLPRDAEGAYRIAAAAAPAGAILLGHSMGALVAMRLAGEPGRGVAGVVASSSFFPPARNGRSVAAAAADYARHRVAFLRGLGESGRVAGSGRGTVAGLGSLVTTGARFGAITDAVAAPVLVVHARDDHYVPLDFAVAAARRPGWEMVVLDGGGHYPQRSHPAQWLTAVGPWLERLGVGHT